MTVEFEEVDLPGMPVIDNDSVGLHRDLGRPR
jgi:hypothetical protein